MDADTVARWLIFAGLVTICIGAGIFLVGRVPFLGRLPGDLSFKSDSVAIFIPIATSIILSIILTIVLNIIIRLR
jgi:hypothetical protein